MGRRRVSVEALPVASREAVDAGPPGSYFIDRERTAFYLRCPCGRCNKVNTLPLVAGSARWVWHLKGRLDKPSLSPSIHWFETDGRRTHWHGWLRDGVFQG